MTTPSSAPAASGQPQDAPTPKPGTPEYDQAMIAKFEEHQASAGANSNPKSLPETDANPQAPQRPENVPEKFWDSTKGQVNVEALLKSYAELEKQRSQQQQQQPQAQQQSQQRPASVPAEQAAVTAAQAKVDSAKSSLDAALAKLAANPQDIAVAAEVASAKAALDAANAEFKTASEAAAAAQAAAQQQQAASQIDFEALEDEYAEHGKLSEESYAKLEKAGYSRRHVDQYIEGRIAVADKLVQEVYNFFGGEQEFSKVRDWARANLPQEDREAIGRALVEGSPAEMRLAADALKSRYEAANGKLPVLEMGTASNNMPANQGFASRDEMVAAMRDPRYAKDEAYRKMVEARVAATTAF